MEVHVNRTEALNILGLDEDATTKDIKVAYKECVQILHPDRFANNKKLADRATEQFKRLQDAYDFLTSGKGNKGSSSSHGHARSNGATWTSKEAKLAGLTAARTQLVAQRDYLIDERRKAMAMAVFGLYLAILMRRVVWMAGIAGAMLIFGIVKMISAMQSLGTIKDHIKEIDVQRRALEGDDDEDDEAEDEE